MDDSGWGDFWVLGRSVSSNGTVLGTDFTINTEIGYVNQPSILSEGGGQYLVVWESHFGNLGEIRGREILADGTPVDDTFQVNTYTTAYQGGAGVAGANGQFVVVWRSYGSFGTDIDGTSIQGQRLTSDAAIFADGFESGDTKAWSTTIGEP